ncbi:hypothetical protein BD410DRAFT_379343 [Rickenella mellea]|uniref:DUF6534 domain-containing protein n=1 Tax=Rickenella mellea TaxID=50990 RepID=A0A4Y7PZ38_9AGAM|nr:hypothetical protein BD410DRAFT_379343 [Rickenella mellea]
MASPHNLHFDNTIGAMLIGTIISSMLYGVTTIQTFIYFQKSSKDPKYLKSLVTFLWILDSLFMAFNAYSVYYHVVDNFLNPISLLFTTWAFKCEILLTHISDFIVRSFFARRIWILSRGNWKLYLPVMTLAVIDVVAGIAFGIRIFFFATFADLHKISWAIYSTLAINVVADTWTATSLCYLLNRSRRGIKQSKTGSMVSTLMAYCVNTGLLTSIFSIACFISYATMPTSFAFVALYAQLSKLYFNALLAMLNARGFIKERINQPEFTGSTSLPVFALSDVVSLSRTPSENEKTDALGHHFSVNMDGSTDISSQDVQGSPRHDASKETFV